MSLPMEGANRPWCSADNLQEWQNVADDLKRKGFPSDLTPLQAKAYHVIGLLVCNFEAAGFLLPSLGGSHPKGPNLAADHYLQAFLMACASIELLAHCTNGDADVTKNTNQALMKGLTIVHLDKIPVNLTPDGTRTHIYEPDELVALRNLAAHGQAIATAYHKPKDVLLHVELLDTFPQHLLKAFDDYYSLLCTRTDQPGQDARANLAKVGVVPVHYYHLGASGQVFRSHVQFTYDAIIQQNLLPSDAVKHKDWQAYKHE